MLHKLNVILKYLQSQKIEIFDWDEEGESRNPNDNIRGVDQTFQTKNLRGTISTVSSAPTFEGEPKIR